MLGKLIFKFHTIKLMNTPALSPKGLFLFAEIHSFLAGNFDLEKNCFIHGKEIGSDSQIDIRLIFASIVSRI